MTAPPCVLYLDAGNTRLKWGVADASGWQCQEALPWEQLAELPPRLRALSSLPTQAVLASVVDDAREATLRSTLALPEVRKIRVVRQAAGITTDYDPARLGVDRWCALIGARAQTRQAALVVTAGTATTIDRLNADGHFSGGLILPGLDLMRTALNQGAARLPLLEGAYTPCPTNTADAILSGCLEAQIGAIERAFRRLPANAHCLLSGGAAEHLAPHLNLPMCLVPNLTLEGMRVWQQHTQGQGV
ncbi:MAG: type III pantothenate kinase [Zoogloeaceae bacterium]|jgi:type III pantothenate kinase|nr:type III pantothenate kinase [Zoogloeaceae bacterium]